jgi:hypothetical protein
MTDRKAQVAELLDRLFEYQDARRELRKCYAECEVSPAYHCHNKADERDRALDALVQAFDALLGRAGPGETS